MKLKLLKYRAKPTGTLVIPYSCKDKDGKEVKGTLKFKAIGQILECPDVAGAELLKKHAGYLAKV